MKTLIAATAVAALMAGSAHATFTPIKTITKTFDIEGQSTTISINPEIALSGEEGLIKVAIRAMIDASDLQTDLGNMVTRQWEHDECGKRFNTHGADIRPVAEQLFVGVTAQAQLWECVKTKVPKTYFEIKCVLHAFGKCQIRTKVPVIRWEMVTAKTKVVSQSVRTEAMITPIFENGSIKAQVRITKAMPSGLAGDLVRLFGLHDKIKGLVQSKVLEAAAGGSIAFPAEVMDYNPKVEDVRFIDLGGGRLGIAVSASGTITQNQVGELLSEQLN